MEELESAPWLLLGCRISEDLLDTWCHHLVTRHAPLYLTDDALSLLPPDVPLFTREEVASNFPDLPLEARDSYQIYNVDDAARHVVLADSPILRALPDTDRASLLRLQWTLGRGQIYDLAYFEELCGDELEARMLARPFIFDTDGGPMVALGHDVWWKLSRGKRHEWLRRFVSRDRGECVSGQVGRDLWEEIDAASGPMTRRLAGTYASKSGPNCFSTTRASMTRDVNVATIIADLWLHQAPFLRDLNRLGFISRGFEPDPVSVGANSILLWRDETGTYQHACYVPYAGLALNKDSQAWFAPRQLLPLTHIVSEWNDEGLNVIVYRVA